MSLVCVFLQLVLYGLLAWIILSYVAGYGRLPWGHPIRKIYDFLSKLIDPVLRPIRRILPPLRIGGVGLDLSPLVLWFGVLLIMRAIRC